MKRIKNEGTFLKRDMERDDIYKERSYHCTHRKKPFSFENDHASRAPS
jgi:hypothetical protein